MKIISEDHIRIPFEELNSEYQYMNFANRRDDLDYDYKPLAQYIVKKHGETRQIKTCEFDRKADVFNCYF
jgi:hypothetical protein